MIYLLEIAVIVIVLAVLEICGASQPTITAVMFSVGFVFGWMINAHE